MLDEIFRNRMGVFLQADLLEEIIFVLTSGIK
jgi:hypothetical protein